MWSFTCIACVAPILLRILAIGQPGRLGYDVAQHAASWLHLKSMVIVREVWTRESMDLRRSMRATVREIRALLRAISPAR